MAARTAPAKKYQRSPATKSIAAINCCWNSFLKSCGSRPVAVLLVAAASFGSTQVRYASGLTSSSRHVPMTL